MDTKSKIILIFGPTASGKSKFAIKLAKKLDGEIINADSMQVYKQIRILTSRPSLIDEKLVKHHLYGFLDIKKNFSTGQWLKIVIKKIKEIQKKKKIPILVGGTGLYFKTLTQGLAKIPKIPDSFRKKIIAKHKKIGQKNFYKKLIKLDPIAVKKINFNDIQRSIRAYEVKKYTKISLYSWFKKTTKLFNDNDFRKIYIDVPREKLINRINSRLNIMFKNGVVNEIKKLSKLNLKKDRNFYKIIGIREINEYLNKKEELNITKNLITIRTRQYAKRQITWARGNMKDWEKIVL